MNQKQLISNLFIKNMVALVTLFLTLWASAGETLTVEITNFEFKPSSISVQPGDKVNFINMDIVPHTATALDNRWDTGSIASGESKSITVTTNMAGEFYCFYHQAMNGELVVN